MSLIMYLNNLRREIWGLIAGMFFFLLCIKLKTSDEQPKLQMIKLVLKKASGPAPADSPHSKWYCHLWDCNSWGMKKGISIILLPMSLLQRCTTHNSLLCNCWKLAFSISTFSTVLKCIKMVHSVHSEIWVWICESLSIGLAIFHS